MARLRPFVLPLLVLAVSAFPACTCGGPTPTPGATSASVSASAAAAPSASGAPEDEVKPTYPALKGPPDPVAVRVCAAIHTRVFQRADACCSRAPRKAGLEGECEKIVTGALANGAVRTTPEKIAACEQAIDADFEGCDWVKPFVVVELPRACTSLLEGTLAARAVCRSHVECATGLFCEGVSPTQTGRCTAPKTEGACFNSTDALTSFARQRLVEDHKSCAGACVERRCSPVPAAGAACRSSLECGPAAHCEKNVCKPGAPTDCTACAYGTSCLDGACVKPKKDGEACTKDAECRGLCVKGKDAKGQANKAGTCSKLCDVGWRPWK